MVALNVRLVQEDDIFKEEAECKSNTESIHYSILFTTWEGYEDYQYFDLIKSMRKIEVKNPDTNKGGFI